jgi:radical SAM superfamily enzyme YgiQ (UPF0313 family)
VDPKPSTLYAIRWRNCHRTETCSVLPTLSPMKHPARGLTRKELLASEHGTIVKNWAHRIPVCVVYPNTYHIGMSNLATHILYRMLNAIPDIVCERVFLQGDDKPLSLESGRPLLAFECIFFVLSFELDYINVPRILRLASINTLSTERAPDEPLVVGGGICTVANPEPAQRFFDLFILGDIEATVPRFMERYAQLHGEKRGRLLDELSRFGWAYNPGRLEPSYGDDGTLRSFSPLDFSVTVKRYRGRQLGTSAVIADKTEFSKMFLIEGTRGCPSRCPFCLLGNVYGFLQDRIDAVPAGAKDIGIIGGGASFHTHLVDIVKTLKDSGKGVHLPSLRIDEVPIEVIELMKDAIKTLTFGIEAGTERLRKFIGKPIADEALCAKVERILSVKSFNLKLYFMIGLYGENQQDLEAIVELVKHIKHIMVKRGAPRGAVGSITVHVSPFVPKAATPFQWLPMEDVEELKKKIRFLRRAIGRIDNTYFTHESVKYSFLQGVLARGDRRTGNIVERLSAGETLNRVMRESPLNPSFYTARHRGRDEVFPWDFIKKNMSKERLHRALTSALSLL